MTADEILTYGEPYLAALRLLARAVDQASLCRFERAVDYVSQAGEQITNMAQELERLAAQMRMRNEQALIERQLALPPAA